MTRHRPSVLEDERFIAAVARERLIRDAAFISIYPGLNESIGGFEVVPLALWHLLMLRAMHHPLLISRTPTPDQLFNFLWLLSPDYGNPIARRKVLRQCHRMFYPKKYLALFDTKRARARYQLADERRLKECAKIVDAARAYLDEAFMDQPTIRGQKIGFQPDYYSDAAEFCAWFPHYPIDEVLRMPIKCLFQFINQSRRAKDPKTILFNPSDDEKNRFYRELNAKLKAERQKEAR